MTPVLRRLRQELFPTAADGALSHPVNVTPPPMPPPPFSL